MEESRAYISDSLSEPTVKLTIGDEFIIWAEKYWNIKENYSQPNKNGEESCPYSFVRGAFINKINEIIDKRLNP